MTLDSMDRFQYDLLKAQATPVVGPLFVSTAKAAISIVEITVGIAFAILFGVLSIFHDSFQDRLGMSVGHCVIGFEGLKYSLANFFTLGVFGNSLVEDFKESRKDGTVIYN